MSINHIIPLDVYFYKKPYNYTRRAKLILFCSLLTEYEDFVLMSYPLQMDLIKKLERSCYNCTIEDANANNIIAAWENDNFCNIYHSTCYKISSNLEIGGMVSNPNIAIKLLNDKISAAELPKMTSPELFPQKYVKIQSRIELSKSVSQTVNVTSKYTCRKCKESKCTEENLYNRSLDEGVNVRITCDNCGHKWNG